MITFDVGNTEKASQLAAQAQAALNEGDTVRAQSLFREAAEDLERQISGVRKQSEKHLLRFLAASQYYHGGLYADAQRLCRRVQASLLPTEVRPIFHAFVRDVNDRADSDYEKHIRAALLRHFQRNEPQRILDLLQEHPYALPPAGLAFLRATSCEQIRDYRAAALFFSDVIRYAPQTAELLFTSAAIPLNLMQGGNLDEAWEYVTYQLKAIPHALTSINASLVRYHQASRTTSNEERATLSREQLRYFEDAWQRFQLLPPTFQVNSKIRDYMILCFEAAAFAYLRLNQPAAARDVCDRAIAHFPDFPDTHTVRAIVTSSTPQAEEVGEEYLNGRERTIGRKREEETLQALELVGA